MSFKSGSGLCMGLTATVAQSPEPASQHQYAGPCRERTSLNALASESTVRLIEECLESGAYLREVRPPVECLPCGCMCPQAGLACAQQFAAGWAPGRWREVPWPGQRIFTGALSASLP